MRIEAAWARVAWRPRPNAVARALLPLAWIYALLAALHRLWWRAVRRPQRASVPTVVVGNLVVGGVGKTPVVIALVQALAAAGLRPGVISRGHGRRGRGIRAATHRATPDEVGDEPLVVHRRTGVPVWVAARRIDAARALCAAHPEVDVLVCDDGLQHHALARDAELIVFDERGAGNGLLLPAGPLRERLPREAGPRTLVLYNAAAPSTALPGYTSARRLGGVWRLEDWAHGASAATAATAQPLAALAGRPLVALAGIGHPGRFFSALEVAGLSITRLPRPDHADHATLPWPPGTAEVVTTEKDAVKLAADRCAGTTVWVAPLDLALPPDLVSRLLALLQRPPT
jgi:tetraacyldisaccharide 4'-kinase